MIHRLKRQQYTPILILIIESIPFNKTGFVRSSPPSKSLVLTSGSGVTPNLLYLRSPRLFEPGLAD